MKRTLYTVLSFFIFWETTLHPEVHIRITQGVNSARPIAIVPFKWIGPGNAPEDIALIVENDLRNSNKFQPLDRSLLPQRPFIAQDVQPLYWTALGISIVLIGQISPIQDDSYNITYQLIDTGGNRPGSIISQNSYTVYRKWLRYAGHAASDEIFEKLTGIKGIFRTRIAYILQTNQGQFPYALCISDYDGHNQFIIHRSTHPLMSPAWSPDGKKIAYVTFEGGHSELVIQTLLANNNSIRKIASFPRHNGSPAFSPDGTKIAFSLSKSGSLNLYVMEFSSGQIRQITFGHSNNTEPDWFPDGQNLVFTSDQGGSPQIYKVNINGGDAQRITWKGLQNQDAKVSSDGNFIFMVVINPVNSEQHIAKQDLTTGNVQVLTSSFLDETPSLAPNDDMLIYSSAQGVGSVLNLISTDGKFKTHLLINNGYAKFPAWSPYTD